MPDNSANPIAAVNTALRAAVREIDNQMKQLQKRKDAMLAILGTPQTASKEAAPTKGAAKVKTTKGPGMLNVLLPFMEGRPQVTSAELLTQLKTHPAYKTASAGVLAAALAGEVAKENSRVERLSKGVYRCSAAYFERSAPAAAPEVEAPAPEPVSA